MLTRSMAYTDFILILISFIGHVGSGQVLVCSPGPWLIPTLF